MADRPIWPRALLLLALPLATPAATMVATEPAWHRLWRWSQRQWHDLKSYKRYPVIWRPDVWQQANGESFNGARFWARIERPEKDFTSFQAIYPWKPLGLDMSRFGGWRKGGSHWPHREGERLPFVRMKQMFSPNAQKEPA